MVNPITKVFKSLSLLLIILGIIIMGAIIKIKFFSRNLIPESKLGLPISRIE
jgi:hypothetical protein